ncbi:unnamed protein product [Schistocephalus solidus]|uniref:Uncharacterized protein n=1 Tax=Schistocephalus solidus TaxID=70667 RepID=A0A183SZX9_SCHSO|nr:unnamed protein product [Schistocephalus solidus]
MVAGPPRLSEVYYMGTVAVTSAGPRLPSPVPEEKAIPFLTKRPRLDSTYSTMAPPLRLPPPPPPPPPFVTGFTLPLANRAAFPVLSPTERWLAGVSPVDQAADSLSATKAPSMATAGEDVTSSSSSGAPRIGLAALPPAASLLNLPPDALISMLKLSCERLFETRKLPLSPPSREKADVGSLGDTKSHNPCALHTAAGCSAADYAQPQSAELSNSVSGLLQSALAEVVPIPSTSCTPTLSAISPTESPAKPICPSTQTVQLLSQQEPKIMQPFDPLSLPPNHHLSPQEAVFLNGRAKWWCYLMTAAIMGAAGQVLGGPNTQPCLCPGNGAEGGEKRDKVNLQAHGNLLGPLALTVDSAHRSSPTSDT